MWNHSRSRRVLAGVLVAAGLSACVVSTVPAPAAATPERPIAEPAPPERAMRAELDAYLASGSLELSFPGLPWPATLPPPYVDRVDWVQTVVGPSLQIRPTTAGRRVTGWGVPAAAWREVVALQPDGNGPGMRAQFDCHWVFARLVQPDKPTWNLEPGRPVVGPVEMIATQCNPGFAEE